MQTNPVRAKGIRSIALEAAEANSCGFADETEFLSHGASAHSSVKVPDKIGCCLAFIYFTVQDQLEKSLLVCWKDLSVNSDKKGTPAPFCVPTEALNMYVIRTFTRLSGPWIPGL